MNTEELKAHQLTICKALIEGKQCQYIDKEGNWKDGLAFFVASILFDDTAGEIRIKPEPRKVWIGWRGAEYVPVFAEDEESFRYMSNKYPAYKWKIVEESE